MAPHIIDPTEYGKFDVILLDPPWWYANRLTGKNRTKFGEGATGHYGCMKDDELRAIAPLIRDIAAPRAIMLMWSVPPRLPFAIELGELCGFKYSTKAFDWTKITSEGNFKLNPGQYTASNSEDVLLFTYTEKSYLPKLKPGDVDGKRMVQQSIEEWSPWLWADYDIEDTMVNPWNGASLAWPDGTIRIRDYLQEHSHKPDDVHVRIDAMYPGTRKIELFARRTYPGWSCVGNEIDGLDIKDALVLAAGGYYDIERKEYLVG